MTSYFCSELDLRIKWNETTIKAGKTKTSVRFLFKFVYNFSILFFRYIQPLP